MDCQWDVDDSAHVSIFEKLFLSKYRPLGNNGAVVTVMAGTMAIDVATMPGAVFMKP